MDSGEQMMAGFHRLHGRVFFQVPQHLVLTSAFCKFAPLFQLLEDLKKPAVFGPIKGQFIFFILYGFIFLRRGKKRACCNRLLQIRMFQNGIK